MEDKPLPEERQLLDRIVSPYSLVIPLVPITALALVLAHRNL